MTDSISFLHEKGELSSAKFTILMLSQNRNKSARYILKIKGPKIEPCGTPNKISAQELLC